MLDRCKESGAITGFATMTPLVTSVRDTEVAVDDIELTPEESNVAVEAPFFLRPVERVSILKSPPGTSGIVVVGHTPLPEVVLGKPSLLGEVHRLRWGLPRIAHKTKLEGARDLDLRVAFHADAHGPVAAVVVVPPALLNLDRRDL